MLVQDQRWKYISSLCCNQNQQRRRRVVVVPQSLWRTNTLKKLLLYLRSSARNVFIKILMVYYHFPLNNTCRKYNNTNGRFYRTCVCLAQTKKKKRTRVFICLRGKLSNIYKFYLAPHVCARTTKPTPSVHAHMWQHLLHNRILSVEWWRRGAAPPTRTYNDERDEWWCVYREGRRTHGGLYKTKA